MIFVTDDIPSWYIPIYNWTLYNAKFIIGAFQFLILVPISGQRCMFPFAMESLSISMYTSYFECVNYVVQIANYTKTIRIVLHEKSVYLSSRITNISGWTLLCQTIYYWHLSSEDIFFYKIRRQK